MRKFIFTLILLLAGIIAYMYFFGKGADKSNAQAIVRESKDLVTAVTVFVKTQKEKYDEGEFDQLLDKVSRSLEKLKSGSTKSQEEVKTHLRDLEEELRKIDPEKLTEEDRKKLQEVLDDLDKELKEDQ